MLKKKQKVLEIHIEIRKVESFFLIEESFRNFYTSLKYLSSDRPIKSLSITSSIPSEVKQ